MLSSQPAADTLTMLLNQLLVTLGPPVATALAAVAVAWVSGQSSGKVRAKVGDVEVEARTPEEADRMLRLAHEHRGSAPNGVKTPWTG